MNIRQAKVEDAAGIAHLHVDNWLANYKDILPEKALRTWTYQEREARWKKSIKSAISGGNMTFVAEQNNSIIGFVLSGTMRDERLRMRYSGEVYGLFVNKKFQRQGLGRELLNTSFLHLKNQHHEKAAMWTLSENVCRSFFQKTGADKVYDTPVEIGGKTYTNIAYAWEEIPITRRDMQ
ncbi:GNAT family N-acetyltransferase [Alkalicoccus daliensis]|uniref:Acetyltransferase (GNAT) family protein n=1 Tax=Alkalicoccus daliensis TaxID=745820 RepID=A0A1G9ZNC7_9BACI|nr:GNAT family N-acetyltransferase [Alkalicoccus daliensis]SDN22637.1 Acetyltransferase (GNAT) family protein [Alkalicoccus daliensis]